MLDVKTDFSFCHCRLVLEAVINRSSVFIYFRYIIGNRMCCRTYRHVVDGHRLGRFTAEFNGLHRFVSFIIGCHGRQLFIFKQGYIEGVSYFLRLRISFRVIYHNVLADFHLTQVHVLRRLVVVGNRHFSGFRIGRVKRGVIVIVRSFMIHRVALRIQFFHRIVNQLVTVILRQVRPSVGPSAIFI